jgi:hypothetical protein
MLPVALAVAITFVAPPMNQANPPELARAAAVRFMARFQTNVVQPVIVLCDVPFITHEQKTLRSLGEVRQYLETMMSAAPPERQPNAVIRVRPYAETRSETAEEVLEVRDPVLKDGGYVVLVGRGGKLGGVLLVRIKAGFAKIVGMG